jgi:hypothetical protein
MKKTRIFFYPVQTEADFCPGDGQFHTVFRTRHGRRIYLALDLAEDEDTCMIRECVYVDREREASPRKLTTRLFSVSELSKVLKRELDCCVGDFILGDDSYHYLDAITKEELIEQTAGEERPYVLIFLRMGTRLYTCFKNRHRRAVCLEVNVHPELTGRAVITKCCYCDPRAERSGREVTPRGLVTISFPYSPENLLKIVNTELEGGFSAAVIADDYQLTDIRHPFCGRI